MKKQRFILYNNEVDEVKPRKWSQSLTVPDKTYTVREIIERSKAGNMPDVLRNQTYGEEIEIHTTIVDPLTQAENSAYRLQEKAVLLSKQNSKC